MPKSDTEQTFIVNRDDVNPFLHISATASIWFYGSYHTMWLLIVN
jgi:hypothetical protein